MTKKPAPEGRKGPDATCRVVLLHGKEGMLKQLHTQALRDALAKAHGTVDTVSFDGATARAADVLDECRSFGLIAGYKLVVLDRAEMLIKEDVRPLFERYCESVADEAEVGATLLIRAETWRPGNLDKAIAKVGVIVKCEEPSRDEAITWAIRRGAKEHQVEVQPAAAGMLVDRVGAHLARLDSELGKLAAATGGGPITAALVGEMVAATREEKVWGIQSTLLGAGPQESLAHLRYVLDVSGEPTVLVSWALVDLARKVHAAARAMEQGTSPGELFKRLKLWGSSGEAILGAAKRLGAARSLELLRSAVRADRHQKSGVGEPERTLEMLVLEMSGAARS
jgi:DNA polymerase III delta subunit